MPTALRPSTSGSSDSAKCGATRGSSSRSEGPSRRPADLAFWTVKHTQRYPRSRRSGLGARAEAALHDVLELLAEAQHDPAARATARARASRLLTRARLLLRLATDLRLLPVTRHGQASSRLMECAFVNGLDRRAARVSHPFGRVSRMSHIIEHRKLDQVERDLDHLASDIEAARTAGVQPPAALHARVRELLQALNEAESEHVTLGLASSTSGSRPADFIFEAAQADLSRALVRLARLARGSADAFAPWLTPAVAAALRDVASLAGLAPVTTPADLERTRRGWEHRSSSMSHEEARASALAASAAHAAARRAEAPSSLPSK